MLVPTAVVKLNFPLAFAKAARHMFSHYWSVELYILALYMLASCTLELYILEPYNFRQFGFAADIAA